MAQNDLPLTSTQKILVRNNMDLAHKAAHKAFDKSPETLDLEELVAIAYQGLIKAAKTWNPEHFAETDVKYDTELHFAGYAKRWIVGAILEWQRTIDHVPKRVRRSYKTMQTQGYGSGKTAEELSEITGLSITKIRAVAQAVETTFVSLDSTPDHWDDGDSFSDVISSPHNVEESVIVSSLINAGAQMVENLGSPQQEIFLLRNYWGLEWPEICEALGMKPQHVKQLHTEALDQLYEVMKKEGQ